MLWPIRLLHILLGLLLLISGLLKANDPVGLSEKMQEIFHSWNILSFDQWTLTFAFITIIGEVLIGVALIMAVYRKWTMLLTTLMIVFFTFVTGFITFKGLINNCGCFGDCLPFTSKQSFIKNIVLLVIIGVLYLYRDEVKPMPIKRVYKAIIPLLFASLTLFTAYWALQHKPFIDCSVFKRGANIQAHNQSVKKSSFNQEDYLIEELATGERSMVKVTTLRFLQSAYPEDYIWLNKHPELEKILNAPLNYWVIFDKDANDKTSILLKDPGYSFLFLIKDVATLDDTNLDKILDLNQLAKKNHMHFYVLSSDSYQATTDFMSKNGLTDLDLLFIDLDINKRLMRNNPGLIILKSGEIRGKWGAHEYPVEIEWKDENAVIVK